MSAKKKTKSRKKTGKKPAAKTGAKAAPLTEYAVTEHVDSWRVDKDHRGRGLLALRPDPNDTAVANVYGCLYLSTRTTAPSQSAPGGLSWYSTAVRANSW